jgi:hypothetical protein
MSTGTLLLVVVSGILAILSGWLLPLIFKSHRPFGLAGDILVCLVVTVVFCYVEWVWILPAIGFGEGWISVAAAIGDPLVFGWICLWLMRKIKGQPAQGA